MSGEPRKRRPIVAIDGPAGVGKSTTARLVSSRLGFTLVDTGALYRTVALCARERGIDWDDGLAVAKLASSLEIKLGQGDTGVARVVADGVDCSRAIREHEISMGASTVSRHPEVRDALLGLQRRLGDQGGVVLEGRDIGTVVFPEAEVKVFLTASPEVRARRRYEELRAKGETVDYETVIEDVRTRDEQDVNRPVAPLRQADDAHRIESSRLAPEDVVSLIVELVTRVKKQFPFDK